MRTIVHQTLGLTPWNCQGKHFEVTHFTVWLTAFEHWMDGAVVGPSTNIHYPLDLLRHLGSVLGSVLGSGDDKLVHCRSDDAHYSSSGRRQIVYFGIHSREEMCSPFSGGILHRPRFEEISIQYLVMSVTIKCIKVAKFFWKVSSWSFPIEVDQWTGPSEIVMMSKAVKVLDFDMMSIVSQYLRVWSMTSILPIVKLQSFHILHTWHFRFTLLLYK